jgi:hypothetical protein
METVAVIVRGGEMAETEIRGIRSGKDSMRNRNWKPFAGRILSGGFELKLGITQVQGNEEGRLREGATELPLIPSWLFEGIPIRRGMTLVAGEQRK